MTFHTTHRVKTQEVAKSRGQRCVDIELDPYLVNVKGPVPLVLDLRIAHESWGSISNPSPNGHLHYPTDMDRTLNEAALSKSYNTVLTIIVVPLTIFPQFMSAIISTAGRLHCEFVCLFFCRLIGKLTVLLQLQEFR